ncbi:unnamed protein product [Rotaria sp. Silwood2]|nr:unnamed protein product [Rotaria sp. Silwood2]
MEHKSIHFLDLPDEILLIITKKLCPIDVLYSLLGVNKRLDTIARYIVHTKFLDFSIISSNSQFSPVDDVVLDRFCAQILPQIYQHLKVLVFEQLCMKRILLACQYPNLRIINIINYKPNIFSQYLTEESPIVHLFRKQIAHITITNRKKEASNESFTDGCAHIFTICKQLTFFDMSRFTSNGNAQLLLYNRLPNTCFSSNLRTLFVNVATFDDCLCLLDGRLSQLSSFTVNISSIKRSSTITNNRNVLPNLTEFSLFCYSLTNAYDCHIVPLLRQRLTFIDRIHLDEQVLNYMSKLNSFTFHICTFISTSNTVQFLSTNDIQKTFIDWKYSLISCCVDYFSNEIGLCHIYSTPVKITRFMYVTNSFRGSHFQFVTDLKLYDTHSFEHDFFEWASQAFPLLNKLTIFNLIPQENKRQISSIIKYLHLRRLDLINAHIDYANQFLFHTYAYLPRLVTLMIRYEQLTIVTNNFTNDLI